jgi:hypothetical protein
MPYLKKNDMPMTRRYLMTTQNHTRLRKLILCGTPVLTGLLLLFHPLPEQAGTQSLELPQGLALYELMAPIADSFLAVHAIFPLALALLGLSVTLLLQGVSGMAANISRASAFVFSVTYILYETIIGTVTALLVRGGAGLPADEQAVIGDAVYRNFTDPIFGDLPSVVSVIAWLSWVIAVALAAVALRRSGKPLGACVLLGLSCIFVSHASMLGPLGMLLFLLAVIRIERTGSPMAASLEYGTAPSS